MKILFWQRSGFASLSLFLFLAVFARPATASSDDIAAERALLESQRLVDAGKPTEALSQLEKLIRGYTLRYAKSKEVVRIARSPQESLHYSLAGALEKQPVKILINGWADALYLKSLAHTRLDEHEAADAALAEALALAPRNSRYLLTWAERLASSGSSTAALAAFEAAEQAAELAPAESRARERASAARGMGLALYNLGRFNEASVKLRAAKALAAQDPRVRRALEAIDAELVHESSERLF